MADFDVTAQMVKDYLQATGTTGQWSSGLIGSNITAAAGDLQNWTHRQFEPLGSNTPMTKVFSTEGAARITIPDLRSVSGDVSLNGAVVTANESYYLISDRNQSGVYVAIEFPGQRNTWNPGLNTFDINYNHLRWGGRYEPLPNNLSITGYWGHLPYPPELLHATKVLAGFYTIRPDALLSGAKQTPEGNVFDLSRLPLEVQGFVETWRIESPAVVMIG